MDSSKDYGCQLGETINEYGYNEMKRTWFRIHGRTEVVEINEINVYKSYGWD